MSKNTPPNNYYKDGYPGMDAKRFMSYLTRQTCFDNINPEMTRRSLMDRGRLLEISESTVKKELADAGRTTKSAMRDVIKQIRKLKPEEQLFGQRTETNLNNYRVYDVSNGEELFVSRPLTKALQDPNIASGIIKEDENVLNFNKSNLKTDHFFEGCVNSGLPQNYAFQIKNILTNPFIEKVEIPFPVFGFIQIKLDEAETSLSALLPKPKPMKNSKVLFDVLQLEKEKCERNKYCGSEFNKKFKKNYYDRYDTNNYIKNMKLQRMIKNNEEGQQAKVLELVKKSSINAGKQWSPVDEDTSYLIRFELKQLSSQPLDFLKKFARHFILESSIAGSGTKVVHTFDPLSREEIEEYEFDSENVKGYEINNHCLNLRKKLAAKDPLQVNPLKPYILLRKFKPEGRLSPIPLLSIPMSRSGDNIPPNVSFITNSIIPEFKGRMVVYDGRGKKMSVVYRVFFSRLFVYSDELSALAYGVWDLLTCGFAVADFKGGKILRLNDISEGVIESGTIGKEDLFIYLDEAGMNVKRLIVETRFWKDMGILNNEGTTVINTRCENQLAKEGIFRMEYKRAMEMEVVPKSTIAMLEHEWMYKLKELSLVNTRIDEKIGPNLIRILPKASSLTKLTMINNNLHHEIALQLFTTISEYLLFKLNSIHIENNDLPEECSILLAKSLGMRYQKSLSFTSPDKVIPQPCYLNSFSLINCNLNLAFFQHLSVTLATFSNPYEKLTLDFSSNILTNSCIENLAQLLEKTTCIGKLNLRNLQGSVSDFTLGKLLIAMIKSRALSVLDLRGNPPSPTLYFDILKTLKSAVHVEKILCDFTEEAFLSLHLPNFYRLLLSHRFMLVE